MAEFSLSDTMALALPKTMKALRYVAPMLGSVLFHQLVKNGSVGSENHPSLDTSPSYRDQFKCMPKRLASGL